MQAFADWFDKLPILLSALLLLASMIVAGTLGHTFRKRMERSAAATEKTSDAGSEGYIVSAMLGLLALLLGFTFSLAVERFETRRGLVLQEANAIGTSYLRTQALAEPHRSRMSAILKAYTENRVTLAETPTRELLATNDRLLTDLWSATLAANDTLTASPFSVSLLSTVNEVIDMDASRKAARRVRVPAEVLIVLWTYIVVTAGVLGYARAGWQSRVLGAMLFVLITLSYTLILDLDRPGSGGITEGQRPMTELRDSLRQQPPGTFDRWRTHAPAVIVPAAP
jgi:hypothetical protein